MQKNSNIKVALVISALALIFASISQSQPKKLSALNAKGIYLIASYNANKQYNPNYKVHYNPDASGIYRTNNTYNTNYKFDPQTNIYRSDSNRQYNPQYNVNYNPRYEY